MSLVHKPSRFESLPDDVPEPTIKKSAVGDGDKAKKKRNDAKNKGKQPNGDNNNLKKKTVPKGKSLKALAFGGGANDGKKKGNNPQPKPNANHQTSQNVNQNRATPPTAQWQEWQQRDSELVDEVYETELEAALVQSQLDYQSELAKQRGAGKSKKKKITVPLNEFNSSMLHGSHTNGEVVEDEELIEKFRLEAKLQLEREKHLDKTKEVLATRESPSGVYKHPHSRERTKEVASDELNIQIENLRAENELLKSEIESYKFRLKKVHEIFQNAQELKDKAKLIYQVETLTKVHDELNEQLRDLHSQLEQERSKSGAALLECRRLTEQIEIQSLESITNEDGSPPI